MKGSNAPNLRRIAYHEGQLLSAHDLQDDAAYESRLRGLHVRAMHNTWGVALGFEMSRLNERLLQVGPGIAYDALGREIISSQTYTLGMPVTPKAAGVTAYWFDLVIRYRSEIGAGPECDGGAGREDSPSWRWILAGPATSALAGPATSLLPNPGLAPDVRLGEDIPLVRCAVTVEGTLGPALDFTHRREAQGLVRPHIGTGRVVAGVVFDGEQRAFTTTVNTSAGGFSQTPAYFARIRIPELTTPSPGIARPLGPFVTIRNPARTSFVLDVRTAIGSDFEPGVGIVATAAATTGAQGVVDIDWVGIEETGGCPPQLNLFSSLFLFLAPFNATQILSQALVTGGFDG